mgnify:CR=1 FL=1
MGVRLGASRVKFAAINAATAADHTLVAASTGNIIVVLNYVLVAGGTVNATFKDSTPTALSGAIPLVANGGASFPGGPDSPAFKTASGKGLVLTLDAAVQVSGHLAYLVVPV